MGGSIVIGGMGAARTWPAFRYAYLMHILVVLPFGVAGHDGVALATLITCICYFTSGAVLGSFYN